MGHAEVAESAQLDEHVGGWALRRQADAGADRQRRGVAAGLAADRVELGEALTRLREACAKVGRDPATLTISARLGLPARRPAEDVLADLRALRDLGVAHIILETRMRDVAELTATYEKFATDVRSRL